MVVSLASRMWKSCRDCLWHEKLGSFNEKCYECWDKTGLPNWRPAEEGSEGNTNRQDGSSDLGDTT